MNKKIFGIFTAALVGAACLVPAACGGTGGGEDAGPVEEGATVVKVMMREFEQWRNEQFSALVKDFNSDLTDGIQVEVEYVIESDFDNRLQSAREANAAPDIILHSYNHIYTQVQNENLSPLNEYLSADAVADVTDMVKRAIEFDGQLYAFPWYTEASTVLFYSKSKFAEAGIASAPTTWAEMLDACDKLQNVMPKGTYPLGMPLGGDIGWGTWGIVYNQLGGWPVTDNWDASIFDEHPEKLADFARLLQYYRNLYDNEYTPISPLHMNGYNEIISAWADQKYAMTLAVSSQLGTIIQEYPDRLSDLGMAIMPTETGNQEAVTSTNGGWCFCIDARSKVKEQAGKVIEALMLGNPDKSAEFFEMSGYSRFPALKSVSAKTETASVNSQYKEYAGVVKKACENAVMEPIYTWNISLQVAGAFDKVIQGSDDSNNAIAQDLMRNINSIIRITGMAGKNPYKETNG